MKKSFSNKKIISIFITLSVLLLLLMAGPVKALFLNFAVLDDDITQGQMLDLQIAVEIRDGEMLDIQTLTLILNGSQQVVCRFFPNGSLVDSCPEIEIKQTETTDYHYGYGYGYDQGYLPGTLKYNVTINSASLLPGVYLSQYLVTTPHSELTSSEKEIIIRSPDSIQSCSVRAIGGTAKIGENTYTNRNHLTLYVPTFKASGGKGSFTAQNNKRISYTYNVQSASQLGPDKIRFYVSGEVRKRSQVYRESAIVTLNKTTSTITIKGNTLDIENMKVNFLDC